MPHDHLMPKPDVRAGLYCLLVAGLLLGSWLWPVTEPGWDALDDAVFSALNGTLHWPALWAVAGDRRFDLLCGVLLLVIHYRRWLAGDEAQWRQGVTLGGHMLIVILLVMIFQMAWSRTQATAASTLPSDVVTYLCLVAWLWWQSGGRRIGLLALALAGLITLPRLAAGAHPLSDTLVGSLFPALLAAGLLLLVAPLNRLVQWAAGRLAAGAFALEAGLKRALAHPELPQEPLVTQMLRGACIGTADLIPGVSGGTMALILGIYQRLLNAIARVNQDFLRLLARGRLTQSLRHIDALFLLPLGIGILLAISFFSRVIPIGWLIRELPEATFGLFFGLIAASVVSLLGSLTVQRARSWLWYVAGTAAGLWVVMLVPAQTPSAAWFVFLCGVVAATAMLLPGISGSFVLLVLGKYAEVLEALGELNLAILLPLLVGVATGMLVFARSVSWLLAHYHQRTMLTVVGVLTGSLLAVWPFQHWIYETVNGKERLQDASPYLPQAIDGSLLSGLVMMLVGVWLYRGLEKLASRQADR